MIKRDKDLQQLSTKFVQNMYNSVLGELYNIDPNEIKQKLENQEKQLKQDVVPSQESNVKSVVTKGSPRARMKIPSSNKPTNEADERRNDKASGYVELNHGVAPKP